MSLSDRKERFCREYAQTLDAKEAARRAGMARWRTAGPKLLEDPEISARVAHLMAGNPADAEYSAQHLMRRLIEIDQMDLSDIYCPETGALLPVHEWPRVWRISIGGVETVEMRTTGEVASFVKKIKMPDKIKVLELLGKHIEVSAFRESASVNVSLSGIDELHAKRIAANGK